MPTDLDIELPSSQWKGHDAVRQITGKSHYALLSEFGPDVVQHARPVAYILRSDGAGGTGFLIALDLLLTNQHVLNNADQAARCEVFFDYLQAGRDAQGRPLHADRYTCAVTGPNGLFYASPYLDNGADPNHLDFALVRVTQPTAPGTKWGYVVLKPDAVVQDNMELTIIQHPQHKPTMVGQGVGQLKHKDNLVIQYVTDTEYGSSGSPVFNRWWQVVALHHARVQLPQVTHADGTVEASQKGNEGINIAAILHHLQQHAPQLHLPTT